MSTTGYDGMGTCICMACCCARRYCCCADVYIICCWYCCAYVGVEAPVTGVDWPLASGVDCRELAADVLPWACCRHSC